MSSAPSSESCADIVRVFYPAFVPTVPPSSWRPAHRESPRIFARFPSLRERLPFLALAHVPTPVTRLDALGAYLGRDDLWMKRDDQISPRYGGNKVRRYEFVLPTPSPAAPPRSSPPADSPRRR
ncbi:MAG: hypothetical protein R3A48_11015 [Polyangiales bacterium]